MIIINSEYRIHYNACSCLHIIIYSHLPKFIIYPLNLHDLIFIPFSFNFHYIYVIYYSSLPENAKNLSLRN